MSHAVSRKLSNAFEGALAGGGDPATSPLYVFGPFLKLIVGAGVAQITFGASIWLVLLTVAVVAAMYRLVMRWVTDGSGGSGLTEEEFGGWAVKINAGITFVEYTLTFLVSVAALVTFIADRLPALNFTFFSYSFLEITGRTVVAILLSVFTGWVVNKGPKASARIFGPATLAVLVLLWVMNIATIWKLGLHLPDFRLQAFTPSNLGYTLGGYARILALMTGIEVFANLVAAYEGEPEVKARKAFGSLLIIMGSTGATMLITGPAIFQVADPMNEQVSVFTQAMDYLLPAPLPYIGTLIGIIVLLSASAASAQGIQNLALGLKDRHYIPARLGERNKYGVAANPVWLEVVIVALSFVLFKTREETYLSLYAAGVFILLSMTSWAVMKRLARALRREGFDLNHAVTLGGSGIASVLATLATVIIFAERFTEGAWMYFLFIPLLYVGFTFSRNRLGDPSPLKEQLGKLEEAMWGMGIPTGEGIPLAEEEVHFAPAERAWREMPEAGERWRGTAARPRHILVPLDGSSYSEKVLPVATLLARTYNARITLISILSMGRGLLTAPAIQSKLAAGREEREAYLKRVAERLSREGIRVTYTVGVGPVAETLNNAAQELGTDLLTIRTHGRSGVSRWVLGSVASKILQLSIKPVLTVPLSADRRLEEMRFEKILVPLDGSEFAERVLPYVRAIDEAFGAEIILLHVPSVPEAETYGAVADLVEELRLQAIAQARKYLGGVAGVLQAEGHQTRVIIAGSDPAITILEKSEEEDVDVIMLATHGRSGLDRVYLGSTAERLTQHARSLLFLVPIHEKRAPS